MGAVVTSVIAWRAPGDGSFAYDPNAFTGGAQSLAEGRGYRLVGFLGEPVVGVYPPGHSLFLSLGWTPGASFDANVAAMRWLQRLASVMALMLAGGLLRKGGVPLGVCGCAMAHLGLGLSWGWTTHTMMSDIPCHAWIFGAMLPWVGGPDTGWRRSWKVWGWSGFALGMACLWRTASLPIAGVLGLGALAAVVAGRSLVPLAASIGLIPVAVGHWLSRGGLTYADNFDLWKPVLSVIEAPHSLLVRKLWSLASGETMGYAISGVVASGAGVLSRRVGIPDGWVVWLLRLIGFLVMMLAIRALFRRRDPVRLVLAAAAVGCLVAVWYAPIDLRLFLSERYLVPIVPLVLIGAWHGLGDMDRWTSRAWFPPLAWAGTAVSIACGAALLGARGHSLERGLQEGYRDAASWIRDKGTPGPVAVPFNGPFVELHLTSGRKLVADYLEPALLPYMPVFVLHRQQGFPRARYAVLGKEDPRLERGDLPWARVHTSSNGMVVVLEVDPDAEARWRSRRGVPPPAS